MTNPTPIQTGNRNKAHGLWAERQIIKALKADGYFVIHAGGSFGPADVVALKYHQVLLVNVKRQPKDEERKPHIPPADWNLLYELAQQLGAVPIVAIKGFRRIDYYQITGPKDRPTRTPPWQPWNADEVSA